MIPPRKRPVIFLALVSFLLLFFFFPRDRDALRLGLSSPPTLFQNSVLAANKTLGFGAILAVSKEGSSRRPTLLQAANVTDIELTIPQQPVWTEEQVDKFRNGEDSGSRGSILAWMGHHHALQWFLDSGKETALILEDDVDWDIHLRSVQAPLAATAVRMMLPANDADKNNTHYWGDEGSWDLLYLGHCGDYFGPVGYEGLEKDFNPDMEKIPHLLFKDPSLLAKPELHPFTSSLFDAINVPDHTRVLHRSKFPLCTFGYAVTRAGAERLLTDLAPPQLKPKPAPHAFDVAVLHACIKGSGTPSPTPEDNPHPHPDPALRHKYASPGLRCWTLNPELFHHMPGGSQIAEIAQASNGKPVGVPPVDAIAADQVALRNETTNIGCGFWGGGFSFEENDTERLAYLQEEVGRKGKCLKEGRDA